jgi:hypothetical protein
MKKYVILLSILLLILVTIAPGCSGNSKKAENLPAEKVKAEYQCPMKCTEEKFEKPGQCPECGMELEKVANS